jgi:hypothetical protein
VLLPVRNEADRVEPCLRALLRQTAGDRMELIVLDDCSTDGTAEVVRRVAGPDRVRLLAGRPPPPGWLGKPHACQQLADAADPASEVLVFLDADVLLAPHAVAATVHLVHAAGLDLVSPYPRQQAGSVAERLVQPLLQWSWLTFLPLRWAERSPRPSLAAANGQLLAVRRAAYRRAGGHAAVRTEVLDDLALLRAVKANLSPVYALFRGPCAPLRDLLSDVEHRPPTSEVIDEDGVDHLLWATDGQGEDIPAWLRDEELLIADGHHRYSVALAFREEMRARSGAGPWDHMMMLLVDATVEDPPVLPIHRVLLEGSPPLEGTAVRDLAEVLATLQDDRLTYGIATREDGDIIHRVAVLKGDPPTVHALHEKVLGDSRLRFAADAAVAEELVRSGDGVAAFFLPPTRVDRIRTVIGRGERLPQKSTYFWPKPRTGLVIRPME